MGKKVRVATFGLNKNAVLGKTQEQMLAHVLEKVESVRGYHPDLICLPEQFLENGGDMDNPNWEEITRETMDQLQKRAREMQCWIAACVYEPAPGYPGMRYNTLYLIDRQGLIAGKYRKTHPVVEETQNSRVLPGEETAVVVDTDFGRVGLQICFDIGWRKTWAELAEKGAQMIIWASDYDGGNLLNTYAAHNMVYIVSAVRSEHARIVDLTGRTIAEGTRWNGLAMTTIDLETTLFHTDRQYQKIDEIRTKLGDKVTIHTYAEENVFTIESNDEQWPVSRICREFELIPYREYHEEATRFQNRMRELYPMK